MHVRGRWRARAPHCAAPYDLGRPRRDHVCERHVERAPVERAHLQRAAAQRVREADVLRGRGVMCGMLASATSARARSDAARPNTRAPGAHCVRPCTHPPTPAPTRPHPAPPPTAVMTRSLPSRRKVACGFSSMTKEMSAGMRPGCSSPGPGGGCVCVCVWAGHVCVGVCGCVAGVRGQTRACADYIGAGLRGAAPHASGAWLWGEGGPARGAPFSAKVIFVPRFHPGFTPMSRISSARPEGVWRVAGLEGVFVCGRGAVCERMQGAGVEAVGGRAQRAPAARHRARAPGARS